MATYARLQGGVVAELFTTTANIGDLFPPALVWLDVTASPLAAVGWTAHGSVVSAPARVLPAALAPMATAASFATVQAQLTALQTQLDRLAGTTKATS